MTVSYFEKDVTQVENSPKTIHIAVLQNFPDSSTTPCILEYLEKMDRERDDVSISYDVFNAYDKGNLPDINSYDAFIGSGSPYNVDECRGKDWMKEQQEFYKEVEKIDKPLLGICFSHQNIADTFDTRDKTRWTKKDYKEKGTVQVSDKGYALGSNEVYFDKNCPLFKGLDNASYKHADREIVHNSGRLYEEDKYIVVGEDHGREVRIGKDHTGKAQLPNGFKIIAHSDFTPIEAMKMVGKDIYTTQFHPEADFMLQYGDVHNNVVNGDRNHPLYSKDEIDNSAGAQILNNYINIVLKNIISRQDESSIFYNPAKNSQNDFSVVDLL